MARFGEDNKELTWWHRGNNCGYPLTECVKGFNPTCRYSGRALECLDRHQRNGYSAHSEVMITSCLYNHGMRIGDIGGTGEFTPQGYRNKYFAQQFVEHGRPQEVAMMAGVDMAGLFEIGEYEKMKRAIDHYEAYSGNVVDGKAVPGTEIYYYYMGENML